MIPLVRRKRTISAPRRALSVFVVCWINLVLAPCALALQASDDAPQPTSHADHHDMQAMECCDTGTLQEVCCDLGDAATVSRTDKFESQHDAIPASLGHEWQSLDIIVAPRDIRKPPDPSKHSPPLHKIFCIYLD